MANFINFERSNFDIKWPTNSYGLLIGSKQDNKLNVFFPIECPQDSKQVISDEKNLISGLNPKWIGKHALNVFRMLPGNATIIGFYAVVDHDSFKQYSTIIHTILKEIYIKETNLNYDFFNDNESLKIFLCIAPHNSRFLCKKIDLSDEKAIFKNIDNRQNIEVLADYQSVQSNITVRIDIVMPSERDKDLILKQLKDSVSPFISDFVTKSIMLVNRQSCDLDSTLFGSVIDDIGLTRTEARQGDLTSSDETGGFLAANSVGSRIELTFVGMNMIPTTDSLVDSESDTDFEMINRVKIQGRIPGVAHLSTRATMRDVEQALKKDLTRSLYSRLELLTEELHITSGEMEVSHMLLPQRVKVMLPCCPKFPLSDYKFFSETATDVISRVRYFCRPPGMTDEELDINCIDIGIETSEQASLSDDLSEVELPEDHKDLSGNRIDQSSGMLYFVGLSGLVCLISLVMYYLLS